MFLINEDMSIYITRGDAAFFNVAAEDDEAVYVFCPGDVVRIKVFEKKSCENVVLQKDFPVEAATDTVEIILTEEETKIGPVISKPVDYWYEIELNPLSNPRTIIGYDGDGPKVFRVHPEGADLEAPSIDPEEIPVVDPELSMTSERPVQNQAVARALAGLGDEIDAVNSRFNVYASLKEGSTTADAELIDIRVGINGTVYESAGDAVREQLRSMDDKVNAAVKDLETPTKIAEESAEMAVEAMTAAAGSERNAKNSEEAANNLAATAKEYNNHTLSMIEENNKRLGIASFELDEEGNLTYTDDTSYAFEVDDHGMLNYFVSEEKGA